MSTGKYFDRICAAAVALALVLTFVFMNGEAFGIQASDTVMGYEARLFDTGKVHTIDIVMDDWDSFIEGCEDEEYEACSVVIDGEAYKNVGLRAKGNTSLSSVSAMGSSRYSFKIEFDHYDSTKSYYGLDKLSLNNLIQDTTYMKDYVTYQLMAQFGVDAPLCSYVYITVNGEDWGLYLAVEGVEDAFLQRSYGTDYGELYKPDSMSFGGGRGNGEGFSMDDFSMGSDANTASSTEEPPETAAGRPAEADGSFDSGDFAGGMSFGMGSSDVKLQYIDEDPDSYSNIFDNAKTDITEADEERLISSLKKLSANEDIEDVVNVDEVLRYFVVHNFVCNDDSYTGMMVHNYYLYEEDGQLSMIPWDYNLAFGTFSADDATGTVNTPIDTPASGGSMEDLPMLNWIFQSEEYTELYHQYFGEFLENVDFSELIETTKELIAPYVEKDATAFYTCEEFETGVETLKSFCELRKESIEGQLDGTIPSTTSGQNEDSSSLVDASDLSLSDMGSMNDTGNGGGMAMPGGDFDASNGSFPAFDGNQPPERPDTGAEPESAGAAAPSNLPENFDMTAMQDGNFGDASGSSQAGTGVQEIVLLGVSAAVMALGLLIAFLFKGKR